VDLFVLWPSRIDRDPGCVVQGPGHPGLLLHAQPRVAEADDDSLGDKVPGVPLATGQNCEGRARLSQLPSGNGKPNEIQTINYFFYFFF
jgi:hypothetical protein